jgi:ribosomal protein S18 acetylase RimI-like enzyme
MSKIRIATQKDIPIIRQMAHQIWPSAYGDILSNEQLDYMLELIYSEKALAQQMIELKHQFIVAVEDKTAIGYASYAAHDNNSSIYHLHKIYVLPQEQGKNLGKDLLNFVIQKIQKEGARELQLNVNRYNKAVHFYQKQGFTIISKEDIDIGNGYFMNDYVMSLQDL